MANGAMNSAPFTEQLGSGPLGSKMNPLPIRVHVGPEFADQGVLPSRVRAMQRVTHESNQVLLGSVGSIKVKPPSPASVTCQRFPFQVWVPLSWVPASSRLGFAGASVT